MFKSLNDYRKYRQELGSDSLIHYVKKVTSPLLITLSIYFGLAYIFNTGVNHTVVSSALLSVNAIVVAFLVFSMTVLITKENTKRIKNTEIKYSDLLISNTEVNATFSFISIVINLFYLYLSQPSIKVEGIIYAVSSDIIGSISLFCTLFVVKFAIDDYSF